MPIKKLTLHAGKHNILQCSFGKSMKFSCYQLIADPVSRTVISYSSNRYCTCIKEGSGVVVKNDPTNNGAISLIQQCAKGSN